MNEANILFCDEDSNQQITITIDEMKLSGKLKQVLYIRGWMFSLNSKNIQIFHNSMQVEVQNSLRPDVFSAFESKYPQALESGFELEIPCRLFQRKTSIEIIHDGKEEAVVNFDLRRLRQEHMGDTVRRISILMRPVYWKKFIGYCRNNGFKAAITKTKQMAGGKTNILAEFQASYEEWINNNEIYVPETVANDLGRFTHNPLISILVPVYNVEPKWLSKCIDSVLNQYYQNWELCLADDCSTMPQVRQTLEKYTKLDHRIKVVYRTENGHISQATNSALDVAQGEFIALLDNDDELPPYALYELIKCINNNPDADLIYSDEDKIDEKGNRSDPHFKPDWSPDMLLSSNYISHLGVYRKSIVDSIGGFRPGYEGAQDYDLVLRFTELTDNIYHLPKILYHWRMIEGSTALSGNSKNYAYIAGQKALEDAINRRKYRAHIEEIPGIPYYNVVFEPVDNDFISIIIPTRDKPDLVRTCVDSIINITSYKNYEIIIVDNGSVETETLKLFEDYEARYSNIRVLTLDIPFNFSRLNNEAAKIAKGNLLLFLNNDIEIIQADWLNRMAGRASCKTTGAVGAKLLYPDNTIQHAGIVMGMGGIAGHIFSTLGRYENGYFARLKINCNYSAVTGACLMIRKDIFCKLNGFEEQLAVAYNDVDLCLRAAQAGFMNIYCADVELYHYESISRGREDESKERQQRFNQESDYMMKKWGEIINNDPLYNPNLNISDSRVIIRT